MPLVATSSLRCNSAVYQRTDFKSSRKTVEPRRTARQAGPSFGDGGHGGDGGPSMVFASNPDSVRKGRSPTVERGRTAVLSRLNSSLASASSRTYYHREKRYVKSNARMSSEERRTDRRPHRSPTASASELAMSDGDDGSRGRTVEERTPPHRRAETTTPRRSLR